MSYPLGWIVRIKNEQGTSVVFPLLNYHWEYDINSCYKGTINLTIESNLVELNKIYKFQKNSLCSIECIPHYEFNQKFCINFISEIKFSINNEDAIVRADLYCRFHNIRIGRVETFFNQNNWLKNGF